MITYFHLLPQEKRVLFHVGQQEVSVVIVSIFNCFIQFFTSLSTSILHCPVVGFLKEVCKRDLF